MQLTPFTVAVDGLILSGSRYVRKGAPHVLFLHGGGTAHTDRYTEVRHFLAGQGIGSFAFGFRGVGQSQGDFSDGSLVHRLRDAVAVAMYCAKFTAALTVVGCSMGGHVAARMTEVVSVRQLVLWYAAAYSAAAEPLPLNAEFTAELRRPGSWRHSPAFAAVSNYAGPVLMVYGTHDTVIPDGVRQSFREAAGQRGQFLTIAGAGHLLLSEPAERRHALYTSLATFVREGGKRAGQG